MKTEKQKESARMKALREIVPRAKGGKFAKGNACAKERRSKSAEQLAMIRAVPGNTPIEWVSELWTRLWALALGAPNENIQPVEWAVKEVTKHIWGSLHTISQDERMLRLEAELERIYKEKPELRPSIDERIGPMRISVAEAS